MATSALQEETADQQEQFDYPVAVEDAGPAAKKVRVTVPRSRIDAYREEALGGITAGAALPGFRKGKAPRHVIERRFGKALKDQVQQDLLRESYQQALEKSELNPVGEPEFEDSAGVKLPDEGDFTYSFTIEVQPEVSLPSMEGLTIRKPKVTINDDHVQQALANLREQQGSLVPVEDRGVQEKDYLIADVNVKLGDETIAHQHDAQLIARPGRIAGVEIEDFGDRIAGMKVDEQRSFEVQVPENHSNARLAGKSVTIDLKLKDIKALELAEIDEPFLESLGFASQQELLDALREQMVERVEADIQGAMRRQVQEFLAGNTTVDLPRRLSERQIERVVNRRAVNLLMRGLPREQVQANIEQVRQGAEQEARRELTLFFILNRVAEDRKIEVTEGEVNGRVAMLALDQGERPEALRQRMERDGSLANLFIQLREQKALDALINDARVEEFEPTAEEEKQTIEAATTGEGEETEDVT